MILSDLRAYFRYCTGFYPDALGWGGGEIASIGADDMGLGGGSTFVSF